MQCITLATKGFSPLTSVSFFVKKAPQKNFKKVLQQAQMRCRMAPHFRLSQKSSLLRIRANPRRGFALFSALNGLRIHPLLRFLKAKGNFAVCGRRQGLLALDLGRFFCKKSSAKKLQKGFATSSTHPDFGVRFVFNGRINNNKQ